MASAKEWATLFIKLNIDSLILVGIIVMLLFYWLFKYGINRHKIKEK